MIRFGPAAAPRWFGSDVQQLPSYLELIAASGGSQIEYVLLPGVGSEELGRVHLLESQWQPAFALSLERGLRINVHAPLLPEFRLNQLAIDTDQFWSRYQPVFDALTLVGSFQQRPAVLVVHADGSSPETTLRFLDGAQRRFHAVGTSAMIAIELRASAGPQDSRFDRSLETLATVLRGTDPDLVGICWDVAHEWESSGQISSLEGDIIPRIIHVHVHDNRPDRTVHAPLGVGLVPWRTAIGSLVEAGYSGSITLEIRYRYASEYGDPWDVLRESLLAVKRELEPDACR